MKGYDIYKQLPIALQNVCCSLYGRHLHKVRYGGEYGAIYESLLASEAADEHAIRAFKEAHLAEMLEYAYKYVPYYKHTFKQAGVSPVDFKQLEDIQKFPTLTKEEVRTYWMGLLSEEPSILANKKEVVPIHTSGSTGKAIDVYISKYSEQFYWACVWRARKRAGVELGDPHINFTGKLVVPIEQKAPPFWRYNSKLRQYMVNMQHITHEKTAHIAKFINETPLDFMVGYPSIIYSLASQIDESGVKLSQMPKAMFPSAEKLYDFQRVMFDKVFPQTKILEHYGFCERAGCASMCKEWHYHEDYEFGHIELKDSIVNGKEEVGTVVVTGFQNRVMPLIRYEVGDTATFSSEACKCGLHSQVITNIEGRVEDYILTPEGTRIARLDYIFKDASTIKESQVVQRQLGEVVIKVVRRSNYSVQTEKHLTEKFHEIISPSMKVLFEYVDEIPRTKSGKFRAVVSELKK